MTNGAAHTIAGATTGPAADRTGDPAAGPAVAAARDGDETAFRHLFQTVQPPLIRYLYALVGADAEDVASEAWLQIARDLRSFRGDDDDFRRWAATIARHRALDHLRKRQRRPQTSVPPDMLVDLPSGDDTARTAHEAISTVEALDLIGTLPREQAEAILLRVVMGLDAKAAAQVLGRTPGAIRTAGYRGLRRLAATLNPTGEGEDTL